MSAEYCFWTSWERPLCQPAFWLRRTSSALPLLKIRKVKAPWWRIEHHTTSTNSDFARELFRIECQTRPVRKYHGNLKELVRDLAQLSQRQTQVIFVQSSLGRAERLYDILKEYDAACVADFKPEAREATLLRQIEHRIPTIVVGEVLDGIRGGSWKPGLVR